MKKRAKREADSDPTATVEVRHGRLLDVLGRPARGGGFVFVPALVELKDEASASRYWGTPNHPLSDYVSGPLPGIPERGLGSRPRPWNAVWARARIGALFGFAPLAISLPPKDVRDSLLEQGFVACEKNRRGGWNAFPFLCWDDDFEARLLFSPKGPKASKQTRISAAFWKLLLAAPEELQPFVELVAADDECLWEVAFEKGVARADLYEWEELGFLLGGRPFISEFDRDPNLEYGETAGRRTREQDRRNPFCDPPEGVP